MPITYIDGVETEITQEQLDEMMFIPPMTAEAVRHERDMLLAETDWWAMSDRTMTQAEIDYRQALRDVPAQAGFPESVTWPTKPE
jgi:hypothetical protein